MAGEADKVKGKTKQVVGDLTDDGEMVADGERDEAAGKLKDTAEKAEDKVDGLIDSAREKLG